MTTDIGAFTDSFIPHWAIHAFQHEPLHCTVANVLRIWFCLGWHTWQGPTLAPLTLVIFQDLQQAEIQQGAAFPTETEELLPWFVDQREEAVTAWENRTVSKPLLPPSAEDSCWTPAERATAPLVEWLEIFQVSWSNHWPGYDPNRVETTQHFTNAFRYPGSIFV